jgi:hypothetical protein
MGAKTMKTFTYTKITGHYYCHYSDDWEEYGVEFDYGVEDEELLPILVDLIVGDYFENTEIYENGEQVKEFIEESLSRLIEENDLIGKLADSYEDTLKEIFYDEAMKHYND